jgi:hypothetical protein
VHLKLTFADKVASGQIVLTPVIVNDLIWDSVMDEASTWQSNDYQHGYFSLISQR